MTARAALIFLSANGACAGMDPQLAAARDSWRGASYDEVVAAWGAPNRSDKSGSQENHTWVSEDRVERGRGGQGGAGGMVFGAEALGHCERMLVFRNQRAVDSNWTGDGQFCKRFAR